MEKKKKDPEYKEEKAVRVKLGDDKEYVAVILDGELSIALGVGAGVAGVKGEFERKKRGMWKTFKRLQHKRSSSESTSQQYWGYQYNARAQKKEEGYLVRSLQRRKWFSK